MTKLRCGEAEGRDGVMERGARSGIDADVLGLNALELGELLNEVVGEPEGIAAAVGGDVDDGFARGGAGAQRIFVGVDLTPSGRSWVAAA